ncbi:hypothetical protein [Streptomyces sp. CoH27]|uniref:hypothetical protein n=1 Tax=Streptomyces sp. CoH27 TaxID=2875763 RepID=UPI0035A8E355
MHLRHGSTHDVPACWFDVDRFARARQGAVGRTIGVGTEGDRPSPKNLGSPAATRAAGRKEQKCLARVSSGSARWQWPPPRWCSPHRAWPTQAWPR